MGARGRGKSFRAGKHFFAQILILRVLRICLQWLEAFEYSVGAIYKLVGPQVDTVLCGKCYFPLKTSTSYIVKAVITYKTKRRHYVTASDIATVLAVMYLVNYNVSFTVTTRFGSY